MLDATALVRSAHALDPLPATVARLAALVVRPDWSIAEAAHLVEFDPALTGRLLRLANSAATAGLAPVATARDAILRLGIGPALAFAAASGLRRHLKRALPEYGLSEGQLWRHSVASALAIEPIIANARVPLPPECFTAALLHDIGKIVLARFLSPPLLQQLAAAREDGGTSSLEAETAILGANHAGLGALIAEHWNLPEPIVTGIAHHHAPGAAAHPVADAVHLANVAARRIGEGVVLRPDDLEADPGALARVGLADVAWEGLLRGLPAAFETTLALYTWE